MLSGLKLVLPNEACNVLGVLPFKGAWYAAATLFNCFANDLFFFLMAQRLIWAVHDQIEMPMNSFFLGGRLRKPVFFPFQHVETFSTQTINFICTVL